MMNTEETVNDILKLVHLYRQISKKKKETAELIQKAQIDWQDDLIIGPELQKQVDLERAASKAYSDMADSVILKLT